MSMKNKKLSLTEFAKRDWLEYAIYTLEDRHIPSMIDGLKPSQRFIMYSALKHAKDRAIKVVEIAGPISSYGYHHGETSAQDAAIKMASNWENNVPMLEGKGNFGSRMVQKAASARYVFAKVHKNFHNLFVDTQLAPEHPDEEIKIPRYYLPLIPTVLLNGVQGSATGFATNILPYDIADIVKLCKDHVAGKKIANKTIIPKYPQFRGHVQPNDNGGYDLVGDYELIGKTKLVIKDIPYQYDRESYIKVLDDLEERELIVDYVDQCSKDGFKFTVTLKRDFSGNIEKVFKLRKSVKENLTVLDHNNKFREYSSPIPLIQDFCDIRISYVQARIDTTIKDLNHDMALLKEKVKFIQHVIDNKIVFKNKNKSQLTDHLLALKFKAEHTDSLLSMNFYHLTVDEINKLEEKYKQLEERLTYFKATTAEKEYTIDLDRLGKEYK